MKLKEYIQNWKFVRLQKLLSASVLPNYDDILNACSLDSSYLLPSASSPCVGYGLSLRSNLLKHYCQLYAGKNTQRFLIHIPPESVSPAGYSWFTSLAEALAYMGIPVKALCWDDRIVDVLDTFSPTVFLTSDSDDYLGRIDWQSVAKYRARNSLFIGLTASLEEYGNTPLAARLAWARTHSVAFYYSFRPQEYLNVRREYLPFFDEGYRILSMEFAANPLYHYPSDSPQKPVDYVFLGSVNYGKRARYNDYFTAIARRYAGFVAGPGWPFAAGYTMQAGRDRRIYAQARIGLNLSIQEQVCWPCELNERTYILAACGIPQLIDHPLLLPERFSSGALFSADSARNYLKLFKEMLASPDECTRRSLTALQEVFEKHTVFHRVENFILDLEKLNFVHNN